MNIQYIIDNYRLGIIALIIGSGLVQIAPIKVNPWSWFFNHLGKALNGEVIKRLDVVEKKVDSHIKESNSEKMTNRRQRIIQSADEIADGKRYSKERWNNLLEDVDTYLKYCNEHPEYPNSKAEDAIDFIKEQHKIQRYSIIKQAKLNRSNGRF